MKSITEEKTRTKTGVAAEEEEEGQAQVDIWKFVFGFTPMAAVKCAIELQIAEVLESNGGSISLSDLSTTLGCSPSALFRIMRYLMHHGFFKKTIKGSQESSTICYAQTPLSRLLLKDGENSLAALILFESNPVMLAPWHNLSAHALTNGASSPFEAAHGKNVWEYAAANPVLSKLINDGMACHAKMFMAAIIHQCPEVFKGIGSVVDVGGGDGTTLHTLVKACPHIRGINFDLPHVVSVAPHLEGIEHVGGDMFEKVPKADAAFLMWVLHDWSDDECIHILRNCREAIPKDTGKVIIAEAVIKEGEGDKHSEVRLALDMVMMAHTEKGKERTSEEWEYVVKAAGFTSYKENRIEATVSVIEAYP